MDFTAAICTYNGAERVPEVLNHLCAQNGVDEMQWEVVVVDNNSTDATADVVRECQEDWRASVPLRYVHERRQGKSFALQAAVEEARGTWIGFLDDDNLPEPDWIESAHHFAKAHPRAGAFGGQIHGLFEVEPPSSFGLVKPLFALNERTAEVCYSAGRSLEFAAPGAGLVVRKEAWEECVPSGLQLKGPTGDRRGTLGEEFELQWKLYQSGWEVWHNPDMHLHHKIPSERFDEGYLVQFFRAIGLSRHRTRMMRYKPWQRPLMTVAHWGGDLLKLTQLGWNYGSQVFTDRFVRGRAQMLLYALIAPFRSSQ